MKKLTTLLLLAVGAAAAVVFWRSQQARDTATQAFDTVKDRLPQANTAATPGTSGHASNPSTPPATTTRLSQTNPDAGVSMSGNATLASDESSAAQPVLRARDEHGNDESQADMPDSSLAEQRASSAPASDMQVVPGDDPDAGQLMADGDDRTITDRIRSRLGQELDHKGWGHLNINTQAIGEVYLRGYVVSEELRSQIAQIVGETEGVQSVVNELNVEEQAE